MISSGSRRNFSLRWLAPVVLIFFAGGFLQYFGLLSQTETNWVAIFLLAHIFLLRSSWRQIKYETLLMIFLILVSAAHFFNNLPISYTFTYFYYVTCAIVAAVAGRVYVGKIGGWLDLNTYFKFAKIFLLLQLIVTAFQAFFTDLYIGFARAPIGYDDAIFGTFFLQSDAALASVCELMMISAFIFPCKSRDRLIICIFSFGIILLGNSSAAKFTFLLLLIFLCVNVFYKRLALRRYRLDILILFLMIGYVFLVYSSILELITNFLVQAVEDYDHREGWETASRFAPLGQIYVDGINFFGHGALTYYNPIKKEWLYNSGFSTLYPLYLDFGLIGLFLYVFYQIFIISSFTKGYFQFFLFLLVFVSFFMFNFALTDLTFVFSFNAIIYLNFFYMKYGYPMVLQSELPVALQRVNFQ
nr:hypothetical protein [uncultured Albidiferax sp.]